MAAEPLPPPPPEDRWLDEPVERIARVVALDLLATAGRERLRLEDPEDDEALHDFRVALRRLRSWLRAYKGPLDDSVSKGLRRRLREVGRATSAGRDREVHRAWLKKTPGLRKGRRRAGTEWLAERFAPHGGEKLPREVEEAFAPLEEKLRARLHRWARSVDETDAPTTFAAATAMILADHARVLRERLDGVTSTSEVEAGHEARIAAKHLRYLLERLMPAMPDAKSAVTRLKQLQDTLGDLHDAQVLADEVAAAMAKAAAEQSRRLSSEVLEGTPGPLALRRAARDPLRSGLLAVARAVRERVDTSFTAFARDWSGDAAGAFWTQVDELSSRLRARTPAAAGAVRRFLLTALPSEVEGLERTEFDEGTLPGERLSERVRRTRAGGETRYERVVRAGGREVQETTTKAVFDALWKLTRGRRAHWSRRTAVAEGLTWTIDAIDDPARVVARVHLDAGAADVEMPAWMKAVLQREIPAEEDPVA